ncbi:hypothetical protein PHPALM_30819 [Phytophthora palmivora]|uniref:Chromo domain-containing protein n=1 Tax=Phytophthora palmivora TaxID=4796 RepID=A0A2P4X465_9STRA|nr:hypothetical protein PHPALM_30819 [Phytophthora palmivora]
MGLGYKRDIRDWTIFLPLPRASINHTPLSSLGNKAPVEGFCALPLPSFLEFCVDAEQKNVIELTKQPGLIEHKIRKMREDVLLVHRVVEIKRDQQTQRNREGQKYPRKANFSVGDYVLRSRVDKKHQDKLLVTWIGSHQIVRADVHSFVARHLVTGVETDVHASKLKIVLAVSKLSEHRWCSAKKSYEMLVSWKGLEPIEDSWEPL